MFEGMKGLWAKSHKSDPKGQQQQKVPWVLEKTHLDTVVNVTVMFKVVDTLEVLAECLAASPAARVHWTQAYTSNLGPSGQLLSYLGKFDSFQCLLIISSILRECSFLIVFSPLPFYSLSYFRPADSNWVRYRADLDEPELQETIEAFQVLKAD